jgi:hypothetical protein
MSPDTPLHKVALYLGAETANLILHEAAEVQMTVLIAVRSYILLLEADDEPLDPIEFQGKVHRFVQAFLLAYREERHV